MNGPGRPDRKRAERLMPEATPPLSGRGVDWDAGEVERRVAAAAAALGEVHGAHILTGASDPDFVVACLAVWRAGGVVTPLHPDLPEEERARARSLVSRARLPRGAAAVVWTSGTSGVATGVVLGWEGLAHVARASATRLGVAAGETWALALNPAHMGGLAVIARAAALGHGIWAAGGADLAEVDRAAESGRFQWISLVPTQLARWVEIRESRPFPPSLRGILLGGAAAPPELVRAARALGAPLHLTYGATETSSQVATGTPALADHDPALVGPPLAGVRLKIDPLGQVWVAGPTVALGRIGSEAPLVDEDGWYATGDLGALDAQGNLRILGRALDRIISGGVNVDPLEVERIVREHPGVVDVCVVGLPDAEWGERVVALVVGEPGAAEAGLTAWCRSRLTPAQRPRAWIPVDEIPINRSGKPDRARARERASRGG